MSQHDQENENLLELQRQLHVTKITSSDEVVRSPTKTIKFWCPGCHKMIDVEPQYFGLNVECTLCGKRFVADPEKNKQICQRFEFKQRKKNERLNFKEEKQKKRHFLWLEWSKARKRADEQIQHENMLRGSHREEVGLQIILAIIGFFCLLGGAVTTCNNSSMETRFQSDNAVGATANTLEQINKTLENMGGLAVLIIGAVICLLSGALSVRKYLIRVNHQLAVLLQHTLSNLNTSEETKE